MTLVCQIRDVGQTAIQGGSPATRVYVPSVCRYMLYYAIYTVTVYSFYFFTSIRRRKT